MGLFADYCSTTCLFSFEGHYAVKTGIIWYIPPLAADCVWHHMLQLLTFERGKLQSFCKDTLPLASEPLWFLETSITQVARRACGSKSSMQDDLPSDWLPGGHREVTLRRMCGGAETDAERKTDRIRQRLRKRGGRTTGRERTRVWERDQTPARLMKSLHHSVRRSGADLQSDCCSPPQMPVKASSNSC